MRKGEVFLLRRIFGSSPVSLGLPIYIEFEFIEHLPEKEVHAFRNGIRIGYNLLKYDKETFDMHNNFTSYVESVLCKNA